jgi:Protein of unknown function (DUF4235)
MLMYTPVRIIASVGGGMLATAVFEGIWKALNGKRGLPEASDRTKGWAEILPAALLQAWCSLASKRWWTGRAPKDSSS